MSVDPNVLLADLHAKVQLGNVDGGMAVLSQIKVSHPIHHHRESDNCAI
jgi:hypothetical protein